MPTRVDEELTALLESGVAVVVGTRDGDLVPEIARGWGVRLLEDRSTFEVCVGLPSGRRTLRNLAENGHIAVTVVRPCDYRQMQVKGGDARTCDVSPEDRARVERHRQAFMHQVAQVGIAPHLCAGFWNHDEPDALVKVRFAIAETYDQTPGPDAGRRL